MLALHYRTIIVYFFVSCVFISGAFVASSFAQAASQTVIKVVDQNQKPLPDAVVEYFLKQDNTKAATDSSKDASKAEPNNTQKTYIMDQINKSFVPYVLIVPKNNLVSFPNSDDLRHHVYSFSAAKTFELKLYAGKPKSPLLFPDEGIVVLGCNIHDAMVGYIYVSDNNKNVYKSDGKGTITINQPIEQIDRLQVWHPNSTEGVYARTMYTRSQLSVSDNVVTITLNINEPEATDSFEDRFSHAH